MTVVNSTTLNNKLHVYDVTDDDVSDIYESEVQIEDTSTASSFSSMDDYDKILASDNSSFVSTSSIASDRRKSSVITDNSEEERLAKAQKEAFEKRLNMFKSMT